QRPVMFQLLVPAFRTLFRTGRQEELELGRREDHGAHVAPVGDQPRRPPKAELALEKRGAQLRNDGHARGLLAAGLEPDLRSDLLAIEQNGARPGEGDLHGKGEARQIGRGVQGDPRRLGPAGHDAVQGAAVQHMPAQAVGQAVGDSTLAGAARPVDGDDGSPAHPCPFRPVLRLTPALAASSTKPGKEAATLLQSRMRMGALARSPAMTKDMAMRWSPWLSTSPPP